MILFQPRSGGVFSWPLSITPPPSPFNPRLPRPISLGRT
ncbi:hypothetical protein SACS_1442 [Parasaccharibacter apium]|uniref:Uncharacterized protein n=1 Tax=Parasaccharibacter apium TaxID=1510841 RepID=A0A7U7G6Q8_9PROT|nr:hypothetical protein SACS_1442 [Parasaccharibacter apium]